MAYLLSPSNQEIVVQLLSDCSINTLIIYLAHALNINLHLTHHHLAGWEEAKETMLEKGTPMMATSLGGSSQDLEHLRDRIGVPSWEMCLWQKAASWVVDQLGKLRAGASHPKHPAQ